MRKIDPKQININIGGENLFSPYYSVYKGWHGYILTATGVVGNTTTDVYSDFIPVINHKNMAYKVWEKASSGYPVIAFYKSDKTFISNYPANKEPYIDNIIPIPAGTSYVRYSMPNPLSKGGLYKLEFGNVCTAYSESPKDMESRVEKINSSTWTLTGNGGIDSAKYFFGSIDQQDVRLISNGTEKIRLTAKGDSTYTPKGNIYISDNYNASYLVNGIETSVGDNSLYAILSMIAHTKNAIPFSISHPFVVKVPTDPTKPVSASNPLIDKLTSTSLKVRIVDTAGIANAKQGDLGLIKYGEGQKLIICTATTTIDSVSEEKIIQIVPTNNVLIQPGIIVKGCYDINKPAGNTRVGINTFDPTSDLDVNGSARIRQLADKTADDAYNRSVVANSSGNLAYGVLSVPTLQQVADKGNIVEKGIQIGIDEINTKINANGIEINHPLGNGQITNEELFLKSKDENIGFLLNAGTNTVLGSPELKEAFRKWLEIN